MPERTSSDEEIRAAALQFVRKVSGFQKPSKANEAAFQQAIDEISRATGKLLDELPAARPRVMNIDQQDVRDAPAPA